MFGLFQKKNSRVYLDNASATPVDVRVLSEMQVYFNEKFYNPSALYQEGVFVRNIIEQSRNTIATELHARPQEIFFMDGATEANNAAILGIVRLWQKNNPNTQPHIITSVIEHSSVLEVFKSLEQEGVLVTYLEVDEGGIVSSKELKKELQKNTILISIGYVNGEIGTIQNIREIMKTIRHFRKHNDNQYPYFHTDAVQAVNYVSEINVLKLGIDCMTINAGKIYGPKKIAVFFKKMNVAIDPIMFGGNQENGIRSGTENVPYVVGMEHSLSLARKLQPSEILRLQKLKDFFISQLKQQFTEVIINTEGVESIPNIVNITFPNISHEEVMIRLDARGIMCSVKSACRVGEEGDSHVIKAIARDDRPTGSLRFSMGRTTTKKDVDKVVKELKVIVENMNSVYKKYYLT